MQPVVDSCALVASSLEAGNQGKVDTVDKQVEIEAPPRDAKSMSQIHVRDIQFGDQHMNLAQHRWQVD